MFKSNVFELEFGGRTMTVETGKYAMQANGACMIKCGDTQVMVNVSSGREPREGIDFFPLSVEYEEKMYSVGKIPGGFLKKEGRPSENAILSCRLIDRPIRPLFPKGYYNEVQIVATVMSVDQDIPPLVYAMIGSSIALSISDLPFAGPTATAIVGLVDGKFIVNPNLEQREASDLDLTVSGTKDAVMMVEAGANQVAEDVMLEAIMLAHEEIKKIVTFIEGIVEKVGKPKAEPDVYTPSNEVAEAVTAFAEQKVDWIMDTFDRDVRRDRENQVEKEVKEHFADKFEDCGKDVGAVLYTMKKEVMRNKILETGVRPDGRATDEVRPIWCETGVLARTHGSATFTRGLTQAMTVTTVAPLGEGQRIDGISELIFKRYMHSYNFPPYSVGETGRLGGSSRREIGHGALSERSILPVLPSEEDFPYAIRTVAEVLSSNGSTSQASVCSSTLSLMDAGVPIKAPVAGIAMGLIKAKEGDNLKVLTDIQGLEDFLGDMDFKVAGTDKGITAIQMDIKIKGIDRDILKEALEQARVGRLHILGKMLETLSETRQEMSAYAPKIIQFSIDPDKIRDVIGAGGKTINKIIEDTGVKIDIEDTGRVFISTVDNEASAKAKKIIESIVMEIEQDMTFDGKVVRIMDFGAFIELAPGKDGLLHISKLANEHVKKVEDVVNVGDIIPVKVQEVDRQGRVNLVRTDLPPRPPRDNDKKSDDRDNNRSKDYKPRRRENKRFDKKN
jgi:polyribonucleotide nucleotidyltransferase